MGRTGLRSIFVLCAFAAPGFAVTTSTVTGSTATMITDNTAHVLQIGAAGGFLTNNRLAVGDPGYNSNVDFDSTVAGDQKLSDDTGTVDIVSGGGDVLRVDGDPGFEATVHWDVSGGGGGADLGGTVLDSGTVQIFGDMVDKVASGMTHLGTLPSGGTASSSLIAEGMNFPGTHPFDVAPGPDAQSDLDVIIDDLQGVGDIHKTGSGLMTLGTITADLDGGIFVDAGDLFIYGNPTADVDAVFTVATGALFSGLRAVVRGPITVSGTLLPGGSFAVQPYAGAGQLESTGGVTFNPGSVFRDTLFSPPSNPDNFGHLLVSGGNAAIANATLSVSFDGLVVGEEYAIIETTGSGGYTGTFQGLPQGAQLTDNGVTLEIDYQPTRVVLRVVSVEGVVAVPTLDRWAAISLALLLAGLAVLTLIRRA